MHNKKESKLLWIPFCYSAIILKLFNSLSAGPVQMSLTYSIILNIIPHFLRHSFPRINHWNPWWIWCNHFCSDLPLSLFPRKLLTFLRSKLVLVILHNRVVLVEIFHLKLPAHSPYLPQCIVMLQSIDSCLPLYWHK